MRMRLGSFIVIFVVGTIVTTAWEAVQWIRRGGQPERRSSEEIIAETGRQLLEREAAIRTLRVSGTLKRLAWDSTSKKWIDAGENVSTCIYEYGPAGRVRVQSSRDVRPGDESAGHLLTSEFTSVFNGNAGATLIIGPDAKPRVVLETSRPGWMEVPDQASGWRYAIFGRWIGGGETGIIFSEAIDKNEAVTATEVDLGQRPQVQIALKQANRIDTYWLDINWGYALRRWEQHTASGGPLRCEAQISDFWSLRPNVYYPKSIQVTRYAEDGTPSQRESIEITELSADQNVGAADLMTLKVPAGTILLEPGSGERETIEGTEQSNTQAVAERFRRMGETN